MKLPIRFETSLYEFLYRAGKGASIRYITKAFDEDDKLVQSTVSQPSPVAGVNNSTDGEALQSVLGKLALDQEAVIAERNARIAALEGQIKQLKTGAQ